MTDPHNIQPSPPPTLPKLTPLPPVNHGEALRDHYVACDRWISCNRDALESIQRIIDAQAEPSPAPQVKQSGTCHAYAYVDGKKIKQPVPSPAPGPKVGDVISADVAVSLPVDSEIRSLLGGGYFRKITGDEWLHLGGSVVIKLDAGTDWTIERIGPAADEEPTVNCACPDCEPDEFARQAALDSLAAIVALAENRIDELESRLDAIEKQKPAEFVAACKPRLAEQSNPDICERWGKVIRTRHAETVNHDECLRRLGLPEMKAVCEVARAYRSGIHPSNQCILSNNQRMLFRALDALDAKEKANGK